MCSALIKVMQKNPLLLFVFSAYLLCPCMKVLKVIDSIRFKENVVLIYFLQTSGSRSYMHIKPSKCKNFGVFIEIRVI